MSSHYTLRHTAIAAVSRALDGVTYTVRHGLLTGMRRKGGLGFLPAFLTGHQNTPETRFLDDLDLTDAVVYDVGGYQGLLTLFFAARARSVVVYEPNPVSRARLEENLRLNAVGNVQVRSVGLSDHDGGGTLVYDPLMSGGASADPLVSGQITETSRHATNAHITLTTLDADRVAQGLPAPTFIKLDVEGMELAVLRGMPETLARHPALYIELHGAERVDKLANAQGVYALLVRAGYTSLWSVEQSRFVTPATIAADIPSHLYCTHVVVPTAELTAP